MSHVSTSPPTDHLADLLGQCARGDQQAFAQFYDATSARAYGVALRVLRDQGLAEEATQDAYVDLWRLVHRYDPDRGSAVAFLLTFVHRRAVDRVRTIHRSAQREKAYARRVGVAADGDTTSVTALAAVEARRVRAALANLKPPQRHVVCLAYCDGLTHPEIAKMVGVPLGTVKSRIRLGLQKMRRALETVD